MRNSMPPTPPLIPALAVPGLDYYTPDHLITPRRPQNRAPLRPLTALDQLYAYWAEV